MQRRTYNNMVKAVEMIKAKGYDHETANELAIKCFDNHASAKNGMSVEWFIDKIIPYQEWLEESRCER